MKKNKSYRSILLLFIVSSVCFGFSLPETSIKSAKLVIPPMINCNFKTAISLTDSIIKNNQSDPFPYILKLTVLGMRDVDFERTLDSSLFLWTSNHVTTLIDSMERHDGKSSYSRMLAGFNKSMYSAFFLRNNSYVSGLQSGFDALDLLKEALLLDSTNTEVLFFLGLYDFARAELRTRFWWALFWYPGNKKQGYERLGLCSKKSIITGTAAALSLSEMYVKDQLTYKADSLLSLLEMQFQQSRFVLWTKAKHFETLKEFAKAAKVYEQLATSYEKTTEGRYNYFVTRNKAAHMHTSAGQLDSAVAVCRGILNEPDLKNYKSVKKDTERLLERTQNVEG